MGQFTTQITLRNVGDEALVRRGLIGEKDVRQVTLDILPDTGASTLFITEEVREKLGLAVRSERVAHIADGSRLPCKQTEPVEICWKNRVTACSAMVMAGSEKNLLGAIPLEGLDLVVDPVNQELRGANGKDPVCMAL